jgi:starvation-inducible outer membrane lipoprotein
MRLNIIILLAIALTGCESQPQSVQTVSPLQQPHAYRQVDAPALSFDPPAVAGTPELDLSRDGREAAAFDGFVDTETTSYSLTTNDWYSDFLAGSGRSGGANGYSNPNDYQRMAITQTVAVIHR